MAYTDDVAAARGEVATCQGVLRAAQDAVADAQDALTLAEAVLSDLLNNPPPPPPPVTKNFPVGVSLGKGNRGGLTGWPAYRIYVTANCPADITTHADVKTAIADGAKYLFLSWKDTDKARVTAMVKSIAKLTAQGVTVDCAYFHEMEDNMTGAAFLPTAKAHRGIVQAAGLKFGPMYQAWTFNPKSGRDWHQWWDPQSDFLGVEAYNPGRKKTPPIFEPPSEFLDRAFVALRETGKPTVAGEFGMPVDPKSAATRPAYIKSIVGYYRDHCPTPVRALLYWDSAVTNDNRLDRAAAQALQSMNA